MNKNGFIKIIIIGIVAIIIATVGYFAVTQKTAETPTTVQKPETINKTAELPNENLATKMVDWESLIPDIRIALKQAFPDTPAIKVEEFRPVSIFKKADITGDGIPEVLVDPGGGGGTTISLLTLVKIENNKPVVARFRQKDGKISSLLFGDGGGGGGRYGNTVEMIENKNAIYSADYKKYGESSDSCNAEAYQWNSQTKFFEFNEGLSNEIQRDYCRKAGPLSP